MEVAVWVLSCWAVVAVGVMVALWVGWDKADRQRSDSEWWAALDRVRVEQWAQMSRIIRAVAEHSLNDPARISHRAALKDIAERVRKGIRAEGDLVVVEGEQVEVPLEKSRDGEA